MIEKNKKVGSDIMAIINKSRPLFTLWSSNLSSYALKIFDVYLSKIDMGNPETKCVVFPKSLLEKIFGVKRIRKEKLEPALDQLMNNKVQIVDKINGKCVKVWLNLMEAASLLATDHPENTSGVQQIKMICSAKAMEYVFNVQKKGYIPYELNYSISLKRQCDYMLFLFLALNRFRNTFEVKVEDLKKVLRCDKEETYDNFMYFNDLILKKAQKELAKKINYKFKYKTIKTGRTVTSILFDLSESPKKLTKQQKNIIDTTNKTEDITQPQKQIENLNETTTTTQYKYNYSKKKVLKERVNKPYNTSRKKPGLPSFEYKQWDFDALRKIIDKTDEDDDDYFNYDDDVNSKNIYDIDIDKLSDDELMSLDESRINLLSENNYRKFLSRSKQKNISL